MSRQKPRIPPLDPGQFTERQRELVGEWSNMNFALVSVRHTQMYEVFLPYLARLIRETSLPPRDREILILRVLANADEEYEAEHHIQIALGAGMDMHEIEAARGAGEGLSGFDQLLMRCADELMRDHDLGDNTWAGLADRYTETQLMEVVFLVGCYCTMAMLTKTLRMPLEADAETSFSGLRDYT